MSDPFVAEIRIFAGNFAPRNWAFCNGTLLPIAQNTALFSLIGTTYGGDGRTTTQLPDLRGRAAMHPGQGPGLTRRRLGERGGSEQASLSLGQITGHSHAVYGKNDDDADNPTPANSGAPDGRAFANNAAKPLYGPNTAGDLDAMSAAAVSSVGGGQAHNNMQPFLTMNFIIALQGTFPSRS